MTCKVIQRHWQWCHSIGYIRLPISLPLQLCLYLAPLTRHLALKRSHEPKYSRLRGTGNLSCCTSSLHLCINQHTTFEVTTSPILKWGQKNFKTGHVTLTTPIPETVCNPRVGFCYCQPNLTSLCPPTTKITKAIQILRRTIERDGRLRWPRNAALTYTRSAIETSSAISGLLQATLEAVVITISRVPSFKMRGLRFYRGSNFPFSY